VASTQAASTAAKLFEVTAAMPTVASFTVDWPVHVLRVAHRIDDLRIFEMDDAGGSEG
jgi:hypothetical protein